MKTRIKIQVLIPRILQEYAGGKTDLDIAGDTVGEVMDELQREFPRLHVCICDDTGKVRKHIHLFLNDKLLTVPTALATPVAVGDTLSVFQAVSGG